MPGVCVEQGVAVAVHLSGVSRRSPVDATLGGVAYADEGGGVNDRKFFEQDCVDQGEDGGVGSDAERESEDGCDGEAWGLSELAQGVSGVLKKSSKEDAWTLFV